MSDTRESYLWERNYDNTEYTSPKTDTEELKFWNRTMGEEFFKELYTNIPKIQSYLTNQSYETNRGEAARLFNKFECNERDIPQEAADFIAKYESENFIQFYTPYLAAGISRLKHLIVKEGICRPEVYEQYLRSLFTKLQKICIRTLIHEIRQCKVNGELEGKDASGEYVYFIKQVMTGEWRNSLFGKYPVLARSVAEAVELSAQLYTEAVNRLSDASKEITEQICEERTFTCITGIEGDIADSHRGGKSVLKISLDNGMTVIYKPHSLENETVFHELLRKLGDRCGIGMYRMKKVEGRDWGFCECVKHQECACREEMERYYRRMGLCIFVFYLLGTNDIHSENIIAHGEYPVLVDLENIMSAPEAFEAMNITEKVQYFLHKSVLYSGALPSCKWISGGGNVNVSGVGGRGGSRMPFKVPRVVNSRSSDIQIQYVHPVLDQDDNIPVLQGKPADPERYLDDMTEGFKAAYMWALCNRRELLQWTEPLKCVESRYLLADTQRYVMCQNSSYHPALMTDGARRQIYLYTMWYGRNMESEGDRQVVEWEVKDLLKHDIPFFYFISSEKHLYHTAGKRLEGYFDRTSYDMLLERIRDLNEEDMSNQLELIEMTIVLQSQAEKELMNEGTEDGGSGAGEFKPEEKNKLLEMAVEIGEKLLAGAVNVDGSEKGWYMACVTTDGSLGWMIQPVDMYLYSGVMGIAVFLHLLHEYSGSREFGCAASQLDCQLFAYTDYMREAKADDMASGIYNGEASIVYGYLFLYKRTGNEEYLTYARRHGEIVVRCACRDVNYDLLDGLAGAVHACCLLYECTEDEGWLKCAKETAGRLMEAAVKTEDGLCWKNAQSEEALLGMSHGNAGIMTAFAALFRVCKKAEYIEAFRQALCYEDKYYDPGLENWTDFRAVKRADRKLADTVAWCHGAGGILMSRLMSANMEQEELGDLIEFDVKRAFVKLAEKCVREGMCLCHGSLGNLLMLQEYCKFTGDREAEHIRLRNLKYVYEKLKDNDFCLLPQERYNPGLMSGYTGVGYGLLALYDDGIADILCLDI